MIGRKPLFVEAMFRSRTCSAVRCLAAKSQTSLRRGYVSEKRCGPAIPAPRSSRKPLFVEAMFRSHAYLGIVNPRSRSQTSLRRGYVSEEKLGKRNSPLCESQTSLRRGYVSERELNPGIQIRDSSRKPLFVEAMFRSRTPPHYRLQRPLVANLSSSRLCFGGEIPRSKPSWSPPVANLSSSRLCFGVDSTTLTGGPAHRSQTSLRRGYVSETGNVVWERNAP